ncbi:BQ2448_2044 [Microbotryum intermedium]|uniref:BQ2448_2044 protein n=1 Tax=Microbotryum intermedium TaxID=269621 RepID=A0A238FAV8_9BASI|nr:BQ2448_2044 [Microbotryum intermedium]
MDGSNHQFERFELVKRAKHHATAAAVSTTPGRAGVADTRSHRHPAALTPPHRTVDTSVDLASYGFSFANVGVYTPLYSGVHHTSMSAGKAAASTATPASAGATSSPTLAAVTADPAASSSSAANGGVIANATGANSTSLAAQSGLHGTTLYAVIAGAGAAGLILISLLTWCCCRRAKKRSSAAAWKKLNEGYSTSTPSTPVRAAAAAAGRPRGSPTGSEALLDEKHDWHETQDEHAGTHYSPTKPRARAEPALGQSGGRFNETWDVNQEQFHMRQTNAQSVFGPYGAEHSFGQPDVASHGPGHMSMATSMHSLPADHVIGFSDYPEMPIPVPPQALDRRNEDARASGGGPPGSASNLSVYSADEAGQRMSTRVGDQRLENRLMLAAAGRSTLPTIVQSRPETVVDYSDAYGGELDEFVEEEWGELFCIPSMRVCLITDAWLGRIDEVHRPQSNASPLNPSASVPSRGPPLTTRREPKEQGARVDSKPLRDLEETFASLATRNNSIKRANAPPALAPSSSTEPAAVGAASQHNLNVRSTAEQRLISEMGLPSPALSSLSEAPPSFNTPSFAAPNWMVIPAIVEPNGFMPLAQQNMSNDQRYRSATESIYGCYDDENTTAQLKGLPSKSSSADVI